MDNFKRIDIKLIFPDFYNKLQALVSQCPKYYAISGYRDPLEQEKLYAIGRTVDLSKKPVTNAAPWKSYHNFGLAVDFVLDKDLKPGIQPDWDINSYKELADCAIKLGLQAGYYFKTFKEGPHIQFPIKTNLSSLKDLYLKVNNLEDFWKSLLKNKLI